MLARTRRAVSAPYLSLSQSKPLLNFWPAILIGRIQRGLVSTECSTCGLSSRAARAGDRVSEVISEITEAAEMVTANCRKNIPGMPGMKAVGTNTAVRIRAIATTGPDT